MEIKYLSQIDFDLIYDKAPRLAVDAVIGNNRKGFLMTKRAISPRKNWWHTVGGTVLKNESVFKAIKRICKKELGVDVEVEKRNPLGVVEIIKTFEHTLSCLMKVKIKKGQKIELNREATEWKYFKKGNFPNNSIPEQVEFLENMRE